MKTILQSIGLFLFTFCSHAAYAQGWDTFIDIPDEDHWPVHTLEDENSGDLYHISFDISYPNYVSLTKLDHFGQILWQVNLEEQIEFYQSFQGNQAFDLGFTPDGHLAFIGGRQINSDHYITWLIINAEDGSEIAYHQYELPTDFNNVEAAIFTSDQHLVFAGGIDDDPDFYLQKYMLDGTLIGDWTYDIYPDDNFISFDARANETTDGGYAFLAIKTSEPLVTEQIELLKFNTNGTLTFNSSFGVDHRVGLTNIQIFENNDFFFHGVEYTIVDTINESQYEMELDQFFIRLDQEGNQLWKHYIPASLVHKDFKNIYERQDGTILFANGSWGQIYFRSIDSTGNFNYVINSFDAPSAEGANDPSPFVLEVEDGNYLVSYTADNDLHFGKFDSDLNLIWHRRFEHDFGIDTLHLIGVFNMQHLSNGNYLAEALHVPNSSLFGHSHSYLIELDTAGRVNDRIIKGHLVFDMNDNCTYDSLEYGLENWPIAFGDTIINYATTIANGEYYFYSDLEDSIVTATPATINPYWEYCLPTTIDTFELGELCVNMDFVVTPAIECSYLTVDIGTRGLRPCMETNYPVTYCNYGTVTAEDAYIEISIDEDILEITGATIPYITTDSSVIFEVGDIPIFECNTFHVNTLVACDTLVIGLTSCVEAHIYPDSSCSTQPFGYEGPFIEVTSECQDSSLYFFIRNSGNEAMMESLDYVVIEDAVLYSTDNFNLGAGDTETVVVPANGATYTLHAEQVPGIPGNSLPILSVEACGTNNDGTTSMGFVNQFPLNDYDHFIDIECQQVTAGYDPNDKQASPEGYHDEHFIWPNQPLDYQINFQNTGNDTAFKVVLVDTLSALLNPMTVRPGVSSHDYEFSMTGEGILTFTFNNILLPDSTTNESASHGFVKFHVEQMPDLAPGTQIFNRAGIYFDINSVVLTNTVFHTIGENFIILNPVSTTNPENPLLNNIKVYPNPFVDRATIEIENGENINGHFLLYDLSGKQIAMKAFYNGVVNFERNQLLSGIYFFQLQTEKGIIGSGKISVK